MGDNEFHLHPMFIDISYMINIYNIYIYSYYMIRSFIHSTHSFISFILHEAPARKSSMLRSGAAFAKSFAYHLARFRGRRVCFESPSRAA